MDDAMAGARQANVTVKTFANLIVKDCQQLQELMTDTVHVLHVLQFREAVRMDRQRYLKLL